MTGEEVHPGSAAAPRNAHTEVPAASETAVSGLSETESSVSHSAASGAGRLRTILNSELGELHLRLRLASLLLFFLPPHSLNRIRTFVYRRLGFQIGAGTLILGSVQCMGAGPIFQRLRVGKNCILNAPLHLDLNAPITIGDRVSIGHHVVFVTTHHALQVGWFRCGEATPKPIIVEDGSWIAASVTILPGVRIGQGAVVAAGAVVTRDVAANTLVAGIPARPVRTLTD